MLSVKFKKLNPASYCSHIEMQRTLNRIFKRAGIEVYYSKGFNPHSLLKLSAPIPLGVESHAEYLTIVAEGVTKQDILERCNEVSPAGLSFIKAWETKNNPGFAAKITASDYIIATADAYPLKDEIFLDSKQSFIIDHRRENEIVKRECKDLIFGLQVKKNAIEVRLSTGENTLRVDRFIETLNARYNLGLSPAAAHKINSYFVKNDEFVNVDEILDKAELETL